VRIQIDIRIKAEEYFGEIVTMDAGWNFLIYLFLNPLFERELILSVTGPHRVVRVDC
jgi:hypothetical protein